MTNSTIPQVAERKGLNEAELRLAWSDYKEMLIWDDDLQYPADTDFGEIDPKDKPYIQLQEKIDAIGILSRDKHNNELGGNSLKLGFVLSARQYARALSVHISIELGGVIIGTVTIDARVQIDVLNPS